MPDHVEIHSRIVPYAAGELEGEPKRRFEAHVASCEECSEWLRVYRWLGRAVDALPGESDHPRSDELARLAVDEAGLPAARREEVLAHLAGCAGCTHDLEAVGAAISESRRAGEPRLGFRRASEGGRTGRWLALAAALLVAAVSAVVYLGSFGAATDDVGLSALVHRDVDSVLVVEEPDSLLAEHSRLHSGAKVTLRSKTVVLGDGLLVEGGAELIVDSVQ